MGKYFKRVMCVILLVVVSVRVVDVYAAEPTPIPPIESQPLTLETVVSGTIQATILNVSIPTAMTFSVDPNSENSTFIASTAVIQNNTNAPIKVQIGVGNNFRQDINSDWKPIDFMPDVLDWDNLGMYESENSLALGIKIANPLEWRKVDRASTLWVLEQNAAVAPTIFGEVNANSNASVTLDVRHGNAFSESKTCTYNILWTFTLAD